MIVEWLVALLPKFAANFLARVFKDWRRDEALVQKGVLEQQADNIKVREAARRDAEKVSQRVEKPDEDLSKDL
jgi:hypothetical protein